MEGKDGWKGDETSNLPIFHSLEWKERKNERFSNAL